MMAMEQYIPGGDSTHIVELTFQMGLAKAKVVARMGGNSSGGDILSCYTDLFSGLSVRPCDGENDKYCTFEEEEYEQDSYEEVEYIRFYTGPYYEEHDLDTAEGYLIGVQIIGHEKDDDDE